MAETRNQRESSLALVFSWLAFLWLVFIADVILRTAGIHLANWIGLRPHTAQGLWGILGAHILHANLAHICANSIALFVLGWLSLGYSRALTAWAIAYSALGSGALTWLIAPSGPIHIGASGIIFGLIGFLVMNGLTRKGFLPLLIAVPVAVLFWTTLPAMLPTHEVQAQMISWQMHLGGFLGGALASWQLRRFRPA